MWCKQLMCIPKSGRMSKVAHKQCIVLVSRWRNKTCAQRKADWAVGEVAQAAVFLRQSKNYVFCWGPLLALDSETIPKASQIFGLIAVVPMV